MREGSGTAQIFEPPGPGRWELDRSHFTGGTTPILQWLLTESVEEAYRDLFALFGVPAETLCMRFVNGFTYTRLRPLIAADRPSAKAPPAILIKIVSRVHPEFRRRARAADRLLEEKPWRDVIADWHAEIRPSLERANLAFQDVDLAGLDEPGLADHLEALLAYLRESYREHFRLHGYDLGPIGRLLTEGADLGLSAADLVEALAGASPSTTTPARALAEIRAALDDAGIEPRSLDEVRAASPEIGRQLESYLRSRGSVMYAGYDLDSPTLGEAPEVILRTILAQPDRAPVGDDSHHQILARLKQKVAPEHNSELDELVRDAREAMDLRDDNGPITAEWPTGLLRLAMLEAGRRLVARDRIAEVEHILDVGPTELGPLVRAGHGPSAEVLGERARVRAAQKELVPPRTLGAPEAEPPLDALPSSMAKLVGAVQAVITELGMADTSVGDSGAEQLCGTGVGSTPVTGTARTAANAEEAIESLQPGEILVTHTTSPAYNMVLTLVGGLVTAEGGPLCHAAVLSRELQIPAVVGAPGAMDAIGDGDTIEVDPAAGTVRIITRAG